MNRPDLRITGIGGVFFRARDPEALGRWYEEHFGINSLQSPFRWRQHAGPTVFAPFAADTDYFGRPAQAFMVNFRVRDLDSFLDALRAAGVRIAEERTQDEAGRFAWVYDPEGNKIELWEPSDSDQPEDTIPKSRESAGPADSGPPAL